MFKRLSLYVSAVLFVSVNAFSNQVTVFGPQKLSPPLIGTLNKSANFSLTQNTTGVITIKNGNGADLTAAVCSGSVAAKLQCAVLNLAKTLQAVLERPEILEVKLNNQIILAKSQYVSRKGFYSIPVNLLKQNTIAVSVKGLPTSYISIEVKAEVVTTPPPVNQLPIAQMSVTPTQGFAPVTVSASAIGSIDPDGTIQDYSWNFGDGIFASGMLATHIYTTAGTYVVSLTVTDNSGGKTSKTQNVVIIQNQAPLANLRITSDSSGLAPFMASFDASASSDPEQQALKYDWNFGDGQVALNSTAQITHQFSSVGSFTVVLTVTDALGSSNQAQAQITVTRPILPPDPKDSAPILSKNEQTSFYNSVSFLLSGANPVQKNADLSRFEERRISVLKGKVIDENSQPLSGVKITVLNHDEFGETVSRLDGQFDLVVNGGGYLTLVYDLPGYLSSSRQVQTSFQDYFFAPDVALSKLDQKMTPLVMGAAVAQAAQGSVVSDASGERTPTVYLPPNTTASLVLPDGSLKPISNLSFRVTEYTVGENGPKKMPADLPASVAYTHAVELSSDEAIAQGAKHVQFNQPVSYYVDNFLNIPIGYGVPLGSLNPDTKLWEAEHDGVVLKILSVQNGLASLDVKGAGQPATSAELQALSITSEELSKLASLYQPGKSLWRVQVTHFSAIDTNFLSGAIDSAIAAMGAAYSYVKPLAGQCEDCGSIIDVHERSLREKIETSVLPFSIWYSSSKAVPPQDNMVIRIPLSGPAIENDLVGIEYDLEIAGRKISGTAPPLPNQEFVYTWDGKDGYGRDFPYRTTAKVRVLHKLKRFYLVPQTPGEKTWGYIGPDVIVTFNEERDGTYLEKFSTLKVGANLNSSKGGVNGWSPSIVHSYNPVTKTIFYGNQKEQEIDDTLRTILTVGGNGIPTGVVEGSLAADNPLGEVRLVAEAIDGSVYYVDATNSVIRRIGTDGRVYRVAGNVYVSSGDGGLALDANFAGINKIHVGPDGSLYVIESNGRILRKISTDGIISRVSGSEQGDFEIQDNIPATQAKFSELSGVVVSKDGNIYLSDRVRNVIYRIGTDGIIRRFAGTGAFGYSGENGPALNAQFNSPIVADIGPNGELYVIDYYNSVIRSIDSGGNIHAAVGYGHTTLSGNLSAEGAFALDAELRLPSDVKVGKDGQIYFIEDSGIIKRVNSLGKIETLSHRKNDVIRETGVFYGFLTTSMFLAKDGSIVFADSYNRRIRRLGHAIIDSNPDLYQIPSEDGAEIFQFSKLGKHLKTLHSKTGKVKWNFSYDNAGLLLGITDADGKDITLQRDAQGSVKSISNKFNQVLSLDTDASGWLTRLQLPSGDAYQIQYSKEGLISHFSDLNGNTSVLTFDDKNYLLEDQDASGASKKLSRIDNLDGYSSSIEYPDGTKRTASSKIQNGLLAISEITERNGLKTIFREDLSSANKYTAVNLADNSFMATTKAADPRLGGAASYEDFTGYYLGWKNNRQTKQVFIDRFDTNNMFNFKQRIVVSEDQNAPTSTSIYDSLTRETNSTSVMGRKVASTIDDQERPILMKVGSLEPIQISYNNFGSVSQVKQGDRVSTFNYDSNGFLSGVTDPLSRQHQMINDSIGRMTRQGSPSGDVIDFMYDKNSNLTAIHPFGKDWHEFVYNVVDLFSVYKAPVVGSENSVRSYTFNSSRDLQKITRADGQEIIYGYDSLKARVTSIGMGTQVINLAYQDYLGNTTGFTNTENGAFTGFQYIGSKPSVWQEYGLQALSASNLQSYLYFTRDSYGHISSILHQQYGQSTPSSMLIPFTYEGDGLLASAGSMVISRSADNGLITGTQLDSNVDSYAYNNFGELSGYQSTALTYSVQRDKLGRITQKTEITSEGSNSYAYTYDANDRLARVEKNGSVLSQYSYDGNGNRISVIRNGQTTASTYDNQDRILQQGNTQYSFNAEGELTQKTQGSSITKYQYGLFGQLKNVQLPNGHVISYHMNGLGLRIGRSVDGVFQKFYQWQSGTQLYAEVNSTGTEVSRFVYGIQEHSPDYMIKGGVNYRFIKDHLGSIRFVLNVTDGTVAQKLEYDEWGNVLVDSNPGFQPFGFAGGLYDSDTKLVRFGARDYDAETGRWTSKDPIGFAGGDANLYGYVANDPINWIDPSGLKVFFINLGGLISISKAPGTSIGSVASSGFGFGFDTDTLSFFSFVTTGTGNRSSGAYGGVGLSAGYYSGNKCEFMGAGSDTGFSLGAGLFGGGAHITTSSGKNGFTLDFYGPGLGASGYSQSTNTGNP